MVLSTDKAMKTCIMLLLAFLVAGPAYAAKDKKEPKKDSRDKMLDERKQQREAVKSYIESKDTNEDGKLTKEEFIAGEKDAEKAGKLYDEFNKNRDRTLTKSELTKLLESTGELGKKDSKKK